MARVVILTGSPHYEGASQKLADNFEKGVKEKPAITFIVMMQVFKEIVSRIFYN